MIVTVLGTGANGGVPQWDCCCSNCTRARLIESQRRTRSSIAVSIDGKSHILIDASPDLKFQLEAVGLTPSPDEAGPSHRQSRIYAILITHGHGDHTSGVAEFSTGKSFSIPVYAPSDLIDYMFGSGERINYFGELGRLAKEYVLPKRLGDGDSIHLNGIDVNCFRVKHTDILPDGKYYPSSSFCYELSSGGRRLLYLSDIGELTEWVLQKAEGADLVMIDATFWWNDELRRSSGIDKTSYQLGHVPGEELVNLLFGRGIKRVVFTHINHTNPLTNPESDEIKQVQRVGFEVAYDGMKITL